MSVDDVEAPATGNRDREATLRALAEAPDAASRTQAFLTAAAVHGPVRLGAGGADGALLDGICPRWDGTGPSPPWWDAETGGVALAGADLSGARLTGAVLPKAMLREAVLTDAVARSADFAGANLEQARFERADLGGATFLGAHAHEADFSGAMLEDARFTGASLRFVKFRATLLEGADFAGADLWGADLTDAQADEANFARANGDELNLGGSDCSGADFSAASLRKLKAAGAKLRGAKFEGAKLDGAILDGADLSNASLPRANLLTCSLKHVRLDGAWLESTRMRVDQLGGSVGEELAGEYHAARDAYIVLEQNFRTLGNGSGASWAFRKGRRMGKLHERQTALHAWNAGHNRKAATHGLNWIAAGFVEWLCDYGESLGRVLRAFAVAVVAFAIFYGATGSLTRLTTLPGAPSKVVTENPFDLLVFSFLNMLSTSAPDVGLRPISPVFYLVTSIQGALGIVLIGLFGYVLGNRMRR